MLHSWDWEVHIDVKTDISRKVSVSEMRVCVKEGERAGLRDKMEHTTQQPLVPHPPSFPHLFIHLITPSPLDHS